MRPVPAVVVALLSAPLFAQAPFTEKIEVSVVNVDVTVTDSRGNPVHGLTKDDFEVFEDGAPQTVTNFYAVDGASTGTKTDDRFRRKVMVLIDTLSTTPFERNQAIAHLEKLINDRFQSGDYDWSIASVGLELRLLLPPTSDKNAIHEALDQIRANHAPLDRAFSNNPSERRATTPLNTLLKEMQEREDEEAIDKHMDAIVEAVRAFGATSGKKIILLLTGQLLPDDRFLTNLAASRVVVSARNWLVHEANASNVNLYMLNPEGVAAGDPSMYWLARETGGRTMPGNDVAASLRQFDNRSSNYYSLGYRPSHSADGKDHRISIRLKKGSYALQYRDSYSDLPESEQVDRTLGTAFGTLMVTGSSIPVTIEFRDARDTGEGVEVKMQTSVPADRLTFLPVDDGASSRADIFISQFDASGRTIWHVRLTRDAKLGKNDSPGVFNETTELYFEKGKSYRIVVAVRDEVTGALGVTQQIVQF